MKNEEIRRSKFGSVRAYTRHTEACEVGKIDPSLNGCDCPKWIYVRAKGVNPVRYSLKTTSWEEATNRATEALQSLDPAVGHATARPQKTTRLTLAGAAQRWMDRTTRVLAAKKTQREGDEDVIDTGGTVVNYRTLLNQLEAWGAAHKIQYIDQVTTEALESWRSSKTWLNLAVTTRQQRWSCLRSYFGYLHLLKLIPENPIASLKADHTRTEHRQGPYTDAQVEAILGSIDKTIPTSGRADEEIGRASCRERV